MSVLTRGLTQHTRPPYSNFGRTDPLDCGLVGEWRIEEATGTILPDYSPYVQYGEIAAATSWIMTRHGPALEFTENTTKYVRVSPAQKLADLLYPLTVELFFYYRSQAGVGYLVALRNDTENQWGVLIMNTHVIRIAQSTGTASSTAISENAWYHAVCTLNEAGTTASFIVNGIDVTDDAGIPAPTSATCDFYIGVRGAGGASVSNPINADICLVRVYDRQFSLAEAQMRYQIVRRRTQELGGVWPIAVGYAPAEEEGLAPWLHQTRAQKDFPYHQYGI